MKGLLLKDWYTLIKQMKIMLMLMLVFACVPGYSMAAFAVVYAAMLPVTALAYDERSKWDELAAMLPYSIKEIVGGKYVLGVTAVAAAGAVAAVAQLILSRFGWTQFDAEAAFALLFTACLALIMLAIYLPVMFRLASRRGECSSRYSFARVPRRGSYSPTSSLRSLTGSAAPWPRRWCCWR